MSNMFSHSHFNGDISGWNVSNVLYMTGMFEYSEFNQDISDWTITTDATNCMFKHCMIQDKYKPNLIN